MNTFEQLKQFISTEMAMSHIYQPVMLMRLLRDGGYGTARDIAADILSRDQSQLEYYEEIVKKMPGKVLTQNRGITEKSGEGYRLKGFTDLTGEQRAVLLDLCERRIHSYEEKRQGEQWSHRRRNRRPVPGSVRYEVLKRAQDRCELCGISARERALEVDHIVPKNVGGKDEIANYQALCFTCNAQKRDTDSTDFRDLGAMYAHREDGCLFCDIPEKEPIRVLSENSVAYLVRDAFPVTPLHSLVIPKRHVRDFFGLTQAELNSINALILDAREKLLVSDKSIAGFNIGANCDEAAGQTVFHCHIHLIPRRRGDVESPRGGVRHVIPGKGTY